jgi:two-component system sensor histidine kinase/response regulator
MLVPGGGDRRTSGAPSETDHPTLVGGRDDVLASVAYAANRFLRTDRWEDAIDDVLASLGDATGVDRVYVFSVATVEGRVLSTQRHEWTSCGVEPQLELDIFQGFDMVAGGFERWVVELPRGRRISGLVDELPADEASLLAALGIRAVAVVPIDVAGRWWGWLAFEQTRTARAWSARDLDALDAAADVLGGSIERSELTTALREREAEAAGAFQRERDAAERLRTLDELKDTFLTAVSHELRTPLTSIRGFAATLIDHHDDLDTPRQLRLLERLAANVERLDVLLRELLDLNRLRSGSIAAHIRTVDVTELVGEAVARTAAGLGAHRVVVDCQLGSARLDPLLVGRILDNLLHNAARHTPTGSTVRVGAKAVEGGVLLVVEDDGPGVPVELREAIFSPFHHGPTAQKHSPGTGVGLSLVARFATLHGGSAWVEESSEGGASFRVLLRDLPRPVRPETGPGVDR